MSDDFKQAVLKSYKEKRAKGWLSDNLTNPTRGKLRAECLAVLKNRYLVKDEDTLRDFFDPKRNFKDLELCIAKFELDNFKSLVNFFSGKAESRKEENIKLIAWLIDFEPRPYQFGQRYKLETDQLNQLAPTELAKEIIIKNKRDATTENYSKKTINSEVVTPSKKLKVKHLLITGIGILGLGGGTYIATKTDAKQCMYWDGKQYEAIACNQKINGKTIVALDTFTLSNLKRITKPDTLTVYSVGRVWYTKVNAKTVEFYTAAGKYPKDGQKYLKPATWYIIKKYKDR